MNNGNLDHADGSLDCSLGLRRQQSMLSSDVFVNTKARARTLCQYSMHRVITWSCIAHSSTPARCSSRRSSTSPEPRARSARLQPAAPRRWMLFVVMKERARVRTKARAWVKMTARRWRTLKTVTRLRRRRRNAFYCVKLGHRKSECWKLAADKTKSTSEAKPECINELGATGSGPPQAAAQQVSALTVSGRDLEEHLYIWMLAEPSTHIQGLMFLDSGAAVFACLELRGDNVNLSSSGLKLRSASRAELEHFGTTSVLKQLGNPAFVISFEVAASLLARGCRLHLWEYSCWPETASVTGRD